MTETPKCARNVFEYPMGEMKSFECLANNSQNYQYLPLPWLLCAYVFKIKTFTRSHTPRVCCRRCLTLADHLFSATYSSIFYC